MFDSRQTHRPLWLIAQEFIRTLFGLFGEPQQIAARGTLLGADWRLMTQWLRAGEQMMRHLLLIEAAALPKPNTRPLLRPRRARTRRPVTFEADAPETWRVSFRVLLDRAARPYKPRPPKPRRPRLSREERWCAEYQPRPTFHNAWPLAERAEALLRVFNDPAPYAKRLAARLYATPHRARPALRPTAAQERLVGRVASGTLCAAAETALGTFDTS